MNDQNFGLYFRLCAGSDGMDGETDLQVGKAGPWMNLTVREVVNVPWFN